MRVVATQKFEDEGKRPVELNFIPKQGFEFELTDERAQLLISKGFVKEIIEPKEEITTKKKGKKNAAK